MDRDAFFRFSYGVYIVGSAFDGKANVMAANVAFQVTSEDPTIAVSMNRKNLSHELIEKGGSFSVSVVGKDAPVPFIQGFGFKSGRTADKLEGINHKMVDGLPVVLDHTVAFVTAKVVGKLDVGTHTVFVGRIHEAEVLDGGDPMRYERYREIKGATPKAAPTFNR